ncbi:hypothetical protein K469DRAFT_612378 [Zopfia rhizophila CBS 207.26]|uniref:Nucleolar protein 12 n=1 Tax=Zopfia rhizophila CBS 207.26 TaxID=1314779 RepID=A0A6A6DBH9_9PEZI|nr:hypothetical protein K469DRAFT_612378 [Zopfia rhizophila CBS 207.26]
MTKAKNNWPERADFRKDSDKSFISVNKNAFDPSLTSLFASSLGPVQAPPKSRYQNTPVEPAAEDSSEGDEDDEEDEDESSSDSASEERKSEDNTDEAASSDEESSSTSGNTSDEESGSEQSQSDGETILAKVQESILNGALDRPNKKRKRGDKEEELEDAYMRKLAREEVREEEKRKKKQRTEAEEEESGQSDGEDDVASISEASKDEEDSYSIPKHETLIESNNTEELDKAARTVFLGNVSSETITSKSAKKTLMKHLASFIPDLADHSPPHKVESLRFRSTAFASALPKKAAFAKKEVMDATTKSTNAYVVYSTQLAAREAAKRLNGTIVLDRHLRVDSVSHPAKTDHRRCVFVGNLGFVDDENSLNVDEEGKKKKKKPPGDVQEGLWVHFGKAGKVESVRVVRDAKTRVSKGFAYVQFEDENGVEAALQFNDQKFPPLLPRKLRVVRAKGIKRNTKKPNPSTSKVHTGKSKGVYNAKVTDQQKSMQGRARNLLGKAGAFKSAESFVFEGYRASSKQGTSGLKLGGKKGGKPMTRSSKRGTAWKAAGGKRK